MYVIIQTTSTNYEHLENTILTTILWWVYQVPRKCIDNYVTHKYTCPIQLDLELKTVSGWHGKMAQCRGPEHRSQNPPEKPPGAHTQV